MPEISLARKYRPKSISEFLGQEPVQKIRNRFKQEKNYPQTVLLWGPPGTGKTSLARLIAKEIQCTDKQNGCSCGKCLNCLTIEDELIMSEFGTSTLGITEMDVGAEGGKDRIIELSEQVLNSPPFGYNYNVFILDECHMLTKPAQNALLKMLEEVPASTIIILATTDPDRLLDSVRDRCQLRIQMKPASASDLMSRLTTICQLEKYTTSEDALKFIIKHEKRNPRQCLMLLENVAKNYDGQVLAKNVIEEYNTVSITRYDDYVKGAQSKDPIAKTLTICEQLEADGISYKEFLDGLIDFITTCISIKYGIGIEYETAESLNAAKRLFNTYTISEMDCLLQIMEHAAKMMHSSGNTDKLVLLTTAMRISKVKMLSNGLKNVTKEAEKQTDQGSEQYIENLKAEEEQTVEASVEITEQSLVTVFGAHVKEIANSDNIHIEKNLPVEPIKEQPEELLEDELTEEQLLAMFS